MRAVDRYLPGRWYSLSIERNDAGFVVELSGEFRHGGQRSYRAAFPLVEHCLWHYNRPGEQARDACLDELPLAGAGSPAPQWPATGAWPDWFFFGDPHTNYYEGTVYYDDVRLETWQGGLRAPRLQSGPPPYAPSAAISASRRRPSRMKRSP